MPWLRKLHQVKSKAVQRNSIPSTDPTKDKNLTKQKTEPDKLALF
jgi:hypothetical protein